MTEHSRRTIILSAATAAVIFGLDKRVALIQPSEAKTNSLIDRGYAKFKVGDVQVIQLYDGLWEKAHDPGFVKNASLDDLKAALKKAKLTDAHVPITFTVTVIKTHGKTIMFDSGTGGQLSPLAGLMMRDNMKKAGIDPAKIDMIVMTHFHADHFFGLLEKGTNAAVFPKAEIVVPAADYKFWTDPALIAKLPEGARGPVQRLQSTLPTWKNVRQIESGTEVVKGVRAEAMYGHTPGHTGYIITSGKKQLIQSADITNLPALNMANPDWQLVFDSQPDVAIETRKRVFNRAIAEKSLINGYHWGLPGAGHVVKDGKGYAFVPLSV